MLRHGRVLAGFGVAALTLCASVATPAGQIGGRPTRPQVTPPKGPARQVIFTYCTSCHEPDRFNDARFSPDRWRVVIVDMRERGAKLEDDELERLVEWLGRTKGTNDNDRP